MLARIRAVSAQHLKNSIKRRDFASIEMYQIRNIFMVLPKGIGFDIINEKGR